MGTRYVWERYPIQYTSVSGTSLKENSRIAGQITGDYDVYMYIADSFTFDPDTGLYTLVNPTELYGTSVAFAEDDSLSVDVGQYFQFKAVENYTGEASSRKPYGTYKFNFVYKNTGAKGHPEINIYNSEKWINWGGSGSVAKYWYSSAGAGDQMELLVTSQNSDQYPSNGSSVGKWYVAKGSDDVDPSAVTIPAAVKGHDGLPITVTPSDSVAYGGTILYRYFISVDNQATWKQIRETAETSIVAAIPDGAAAAAVRVQALDDMGFVSTDYIVSAQTAAVTWNAAPVISGADGDLGTFGLAPPGAIDYTVTDVDGGAVNCTVTLDGAVVQEGAVELGAANSYAVTASQWLSMLNGAHTVTITADDEYGATAVRTYTFTKDVAELSVTLAEPWITDGRVARMYILPVWSVPDGATVQVLATNNALDAEPVWQDVTDAVKLGKKFYFANEVKTAGQWAVNFKVLADRGTADRVYIKKLTGAFDGLGG